MRPRLDSFYARWRVSSGAIAILRDDQDSPPERLVQAIWLHQRLLRDRMTTLDGRSVRVLHPGFPSVEGGPDFRGAVIRFGDDLPVSGDVEVDLRASGWRAHGHDRNPAFGKVVLHAVWESERGASGGPPVLQLRPVLDSPLGELSFWLGGEGNDLPHELRGKCCAPLNGLDKGQSLDLLHQAARVRLQAKAAAIGARARQAGWEQALWEGLFRALGYKHNTWPMQHLAELRARWLTRGADRLVMQARLFGISGLLPPELTRTQAAADRYLRQIWDQWWRERDGFADCVLPRSAWRFHGLRPANHPQRRVALTSLWAVAGSLAVNLEKWCEKEIPSRRLQDTLTAELRAEPDPFWARHWTFSSAPLKRPQPMLGPGRVTDLAVNVVLPWLWARAVEGGEENVLRRIEARYFAWPPAEDNSVLRLARQRLFGTGARGCLPDAAAQQGLIQMVRDFCDHSNSVCDGCKLPGLVQEFSTQERRGLGEAGGPPR